MRALLGATYRAGLAHLPIGARTLLQAVLALPQIVPAAPLRPLEWLTPPPARRRLSFEVDRQPAWADLYLPGGPRPCRWPGIVLTLGANELGGQDPRAVALAEALARCGFLVLLVPGSPALMAPDGAHGGPLGLVEAPAVAAAAFEHLAARNDVDPRRLGFVGVCIGGAVCLLAAARPTLAERVAFVYLIGPYLSLRSLLRAIASQTTVTPDGRRQPWPARPFARDRLRAWLLRALDVDEARAVRAVLDSAAPLPDGLSARARAVFDLARGVPPERADELIDALGAEFSAVLEAASPAGQLAGLRAETFVMHGVADGNIPVDESRRLVRALHGQVPLRHAEFELFEHVDATRPLAAATYARELWRLVDHVRPLLRFAN